MFPFRHFSNLKKLAKGNNRSRGENQVTLASKRIRKSGHLGFKTNLWKVFRAKLISSFFL
jgi:hypothetical protein